MHLTVPTMLTLLRIALVPVLVLFFYLPYDWSNMACVVIFVLAAVTDIADGYIARRTGQTSSFGAFLDPVADKIMVSTRWYCWFSARTPIRPCSPLRPPSSLVVK